MDNLGYLFAAFAVSWVAIAAYFFTLDRRLKRVEEQVSEAASDEGEPRP